MSVLLLVAAAVANGASVEYSQYRLSEVETDRLFSAEYSACMDSSGGVTASMRDCSETEAIRLDSLLNQEYREALGRLPNKASRETLRRLERAWLKNRYDHCAKQAAPEEGGTLWLLVMDSCGLAEDARRVGWLRSYGR